MIFGIFQSTKRRQNSQCWHWLRSGTRRLHHRFTSRLRYRDGLQKIRRKLLSPSPTAPESGLTAISPETSNLHGPGEGAKRLRAVSSFIGIRLV